MLKEGASLMCSHICVHNILGKVKDEIEKILYAIRYHYGIIMASWHHGNQVDGWHMWGMRVCHIDGVLSST